MPRKGGWKPLKLSMAVILWGSILSGCTVSLQMETAGTEEALVNDAFRQRESAYARLMKAIGGYCSIKHEPLEARIGCVLDKQAEAQRIRMGPAGTGADRSMWDGAELAEQTGRRVACEGATPHVTCWLTPSVPDLLARRLSRTVPAGFSERFSQ